MALPHWAFAAVSSGCCGPTLLVTRVIDCLSEHLGDRGPLVEGAVVPHSRHRPIHMASRMPLRLGSELDRHGR